MANVLFVQAAVENLPAELQGIATEVHVQFPWGSLLRGVAGGDQVVLRNLRSICLPEALLLVTLGLDLERDRFERERLALREITIDYIERLLSPRYLEAGLRIVRSEAVSAADLAQFQSSWAKRLQRGVNRSFFRIEAIAS